MGYIIEITEHKREKLSEHIESALHEMGKAMQCVESMAEGYGERQPRDYRDDYGMRGYMGYRDHDDWDDDEMGERRRGRRRDSRGRYI